MVNGEVQPVQKLFKLAIIVFWKEGGCRKRQIKSRKGATTQRRNIGDQALRLYEKNIFKIFLTASFFWRTIIFMHN